MKKIITKFLVFVFRRSKKLCLEDPYKGIEIEFGISDKNADFRVRCRVKVNELSAREIDRLNSKKYSIPENSEQQVDETRMGAYENILRGMSF